ncbi:MAG: type I glyceraldehyde-3-phosphate dehydrogenase [Gammaproteobacteria bacterium]|nr:type I glyceraldehyde-3-phosphate dehydrogenase [Gammaproteobacteria bacterium]
MAINVAINGFGRIGRNILRALYESDREQQINIVAINDMTDIATLAHLLKYDSVHGRFNGDVEVTGNQLKINNHAINVTCERDPAVLPWQSLNVDLVYECTGFFTARDQAAAHLAAGAKKVLISAPGKSVDATMVFGVNHQSLKAEDTIVSNASCTTNCLAPLVKPLHEQLTLVNGLMTTIHAYTNDQRTHDAPHKDIRRARAAALSMIPTKTGAAAAVGLVLPELNGRLDGFAIRVPTANVSIVDLTFEAGRKTSVEEVNSLLKAAAEGELQGILAYSDEPLVSIDFNHCAASSTVDSLLTRVNGNLVKVTSWYDNEWGFSNRMLDTGLAMMES